MWLQHIKFQRNLIISGRKPKQTPMATEVNLAAVTSYNSNAGGDTVGGAVRQISGSGVVEHIRSSDYENEMYRSDPSLPSFIQTAPHAIIVTDEAGMVRTCNPFAENMFGYTEAEVFGKPFAALLDPYNPAPPIGRSVFCSDPDASKTPRNVETRARKKNGELFPVELVTNRVMLGSSRVDLHFIRDISFRQRFEQRISELERELIHLSQTNVLGELASAITHELNQPLTAITNYAAAARQCGCRATPEELESSFDLMDKAASQAKRAWQIMHKLRKLVQHRGVECMDCDLRAVLEDAVQLATLGTSHQRIKVSVRMPSEPVMVLMDRVQIQILLTNLVRNAIDELSVGMARRR